MEESRKKKIEIGISIINVIALVIYILKRCLPIPPAIHKTAIYIVVLTLIYRLTQWKENKKSENYFNLCIMTIIIGLLIYNL